MSKKKLGAIIITAAIIILCTFATLLTQPLNRPRQNFSILQALPANQFPLVLELRSPKNQYKKILNANTFRWLKQKKLSAATSEKTEQLLNSWLGKLALRALGNQVAVARTNSGKELIFIARLDNFCWSIAKIILWYNNYNLSSFLDSSSINLPTHASFAQRYLILASSTTLAKATATNINRSIAESSHFLPEQAAIVRCQPDQNLRLSLQKNLKTALWFMDAAQITIRQNNEEIKITGRLSINQNITSRLLSSKKKLYPFADNNPVAKAPAFDCRQDSNTVIICKGKIDSILAWYTLSRKLFGATAKPVASRNSPLTVALWQAIEQGIIKNNSGAFAFACQKSPQTNDVLPVPMLQAAFSTRKEAAEKTFFLLNQQAARVADIFSAPGGSLLWEGVRRETRLESRKNDFSYQTDLNLHPLFFHNLTPSWSWCRNNKQNNITAHTPIIFTSHRQTLLDANKNIFFLKKDTATPTTNKNSKADISLSWDIPDMEVNKWEALLNEKITKFNWAPASYLAQTKAIFAKFRLLLACSRKGKARFHLYQANNQATNQNNENVFCLDIAATLRLNR